MANGSSAREQVKAAIIAVRTGQLNEENRSLDFKMRPEQERRSKRPSHISRVSERRTTDKPPHFLWNAKMRFGKTFAAYQLAKKMGWRKVLVLTFKPAVQNAWEEDLKCHVDFQGWQLFRRAACRTRMRTRRSRSSVLAHFRITWAGTRAPAG